MFRRLIRLLPWAPVGLAAIYLVLTVVHQAAIRESLNSFADYASTPVIAELIGQAPPGSTTILGDYRWLEALWMLRATSWLPSHYFVWQLVPFLVWLATAGLVGWTVRTAAASRWAGATAAALVICGGIAVRGALWSLNTHGPAVLHVAILSAWLVAVLARPGLQRGPLAIAAAVLVGAITAPGATDPLVLAVGVAPLLVTAGVLNHWAGVRRVLPLAGLVAAVGVLGAVLLGHLATRANLTWTHRGLTFVDPANVITHVGLIPGILARLVGVTPFSRPIGLSSGIAMIGTLTAVALLVLVLRVGWRVTKRLLVPSPAGSGAARAALSADASLRAAVLVFWLSVLVASLAALVLTSAAFDVYGARYFVAGWIAVVVLLLVLAPELPSPLIATGAATVLAATSVYGFADEPRPASEGSNPSIALANEVQRFVEPFGVTRGYAGFPDAIPFTWHTRFQLRVYPIGTCLSDPATNCQFYQHQISSWYAPAPGRTFLATDTAQGLQPAVDRRYGRPLAQRQIGSVTVYVYDRDLSPLIGPPLG